MSQPLCNVSQQYLKDPVDWGTIASTKVALMTPPAHVLEAALSNVNPTEVAYVVVMERRPRKETAPPPKPQFRLVIEDDDEPVEPQEEPRCSQPDQDDPITIDAADEPAQEAPKPAFKLILEDEKEEDSPAQATTEILTARSTDDEAKPQECLESDMNSLIRSVDSFESSTSEILGTVIEEELEDIEEESQNGPDPTLASQILDQLVASESKSRKLELQLRQYGVSVVTDEISYSLAKRKIAEIAARMNEIGDSSSEYYTLEQEMEKYSTAILLTDEYHKEQQAIEQRWEDANAEANQNALEYLRRHMPVDIRLKSVEELSQTTYVPYDLLKRFKRTNVITLLRVNPIAIERMHPSTLENMRVTGLTVTERRALYAHLRDVGDKWKAKTDGMMARKYSWFAMLKSNFWEALNAHEAHIRQYKLVDDVCSCTMHRACPVMANANLGYMADGAGQSALAEYEPMDVTINKSSREQSTTDLIPKSHRREELRTFYKGSMRDMTEANVACETMDDLLVNIQFGIEQLSEETTFSKTKVLLADVKLSLQGLTKRQHNISNLELSLLEQVCRASNELCDATEHCIKENEIKLVGLVDVKGTMIATSAIRLLVDEISKFQQK